MRSPQDETSVSPFDAALSKRLSKLRSLPVELGNLEKAIEREIGSPPAKVEALAGRRGQRWWRQGLMRAAAASFLVGSLLLVLVLMGFSGPVLASADRLAAIHSEVVSGGDHAGDHAFHPVSSIASANLLLKSKTPGAPELPEVEGGRVMTCCVHNLGRKTLSCVSIEANGERVTVAVADANDVTIPKLKTLDVSGVTYHVQSQGDVNMVMTKQGGQWICLMGKVPVERLIELATGSGR